MTQEPSTSRWTEKHRVIAEAATALFLRKGYQGTSMDDVAAEAAVSKQTVYKHFSDKEQLFAEIVLASTDAAEGLVRMVSSVLDTTTDLRSDLGDLAEQFLKTLMRPDTLRLRRLVITTADQFPEICRSWYENGFERALATLARHFAQLSERGLLAVDDPVLAAHHFVGLLLWIPINRAMFTGDETSDPKDLDAYADHAVETFLRAYGGHAPSSPQRRRGSTKARDVEAGPTVHNRQSSIAAPTRKQT